MSGGRADAREDASSGQAALLLGGPWLQLRRIEVALVLGFTVAAHIATNHAACRLEIRDAKVVAGSRAATKGPSPR